MKGGVDERDCAGGVVGAGGAVGGAVDVPPDNPAR